MFVYNHNILSPTCEALDARGIILEVWKRNSDTSSFDLEVTV